MIGLDYYSPTVPNLIRDIVDRFGSLLHIIDGEKALTYRDVDEQSAILARGLLARGVGKGTRVGILLPNGADWVVSWFAISRIGAIAVLLSTFGKSRETAHILRHADVALLLTCDRYLNHNYLEILEGALENLADHDGQSPFRILSAPYLRECWILSGESPRWAAGDRGQLEAQAISGNVTRECLAATEAGVHPSDAASIIYTSGSTADPKAIVHTHGSIVRHGRVMSDYTTFGEGDRVLCTEPLFWVGGLCWSLLTASNKGAALVVPLSQDASEIARAFKANDITHSTQAMRARERLIAAGVDEAAFKRLRPISSQYLGAYGLAPPELTPNGLGMSETFGPHSMELPGVTLPPERSGSFGRQVKDIERKIIDPETGETVAFGAHGELCVRGYSLMAGYYKMERSESFDPDGWFHTGDTCSMSHDGHLFFHGRSTEMLKSSGANVAPREVELVLQSHPAVIEAAVVGLPHPKFGQMVVAAVVKREDFDMTSSQLQTWLRTQLSSYKVPRRIFFLSSSEIPRTHTGKIQKAQLKVILTDMERDARAGDS